MTDHTPRDLPNVHVPGKGEDWERACCERSTLSRFGEHRLDFELAEARMRADALWSACRELTAENARLREEANLPQLGWTTEANRPLHKFPTR